MSGSLVTMAVGAAIVVVGIAAYASHDAKDVARFDDRHPMPRGADATDPDAYIERTWR